MCEKNHTMQLGLNSQGSVIMDASIVTNIHGFLQEYYKNSTDPISPPGVKDDSLIESACTRPFMSAGRKDAFKNTYEKGAVLFHGIISNHGFYNGNKRTALLSTLYFLSENNLWLDRCDDQTMFEFTRKTAAHEICQDRKNEIKTIAEWLKKNTRKVNKSEKPLSFNELKTILYNFCFTLKNEGQYVVINYKNKTVKIKKKGKQGAEDYDQDYISNLRKRLKLTPRYGIDSARFYGQKGLSEDLNEFMRLRVKVFNWLAKI